MVVWVCGAGSGQGSVVRLTKLIAAPETVATFQLPEIADEEIIYIAQDTCSLTVMIPQMLIFEAGALAPFPSVKVICGIKMLREFLSWAIGAIASTSTIPGR